MIGQRKYIVVSGIVALLAFLSSFIILPAECSLINNDPGPFFNCIQDFQQLPGVATLCCRDFGKVNLARAISGIGIFQFLGLYIYRYKQNATKLPKIF